MFTSSQGSSYFIVNLQYSQIGGYPKTVLGLNQDGEVGIAVVPSTPSRFDGILRNWPWEMIMICLQVAKVGLQTFERPPSVRRIKLTAHRQSRRSPLYGVRPRP